MRRTDALKRRDLLLVAGSGAAAATFISPPALAAGGVRRVVKQVPLAYTYDPATGVTDVTRFRRRTVSVRITGKRVFQKRGGRWVRIPYVWSDKRDALVYSRRLHLKLIGPATTTSPAPEATQPPLQPTAAPDPVTPQPTQPPPTTATPTATPSTPAPSPSPSTTPPVTARSVSDYVSTDLARHALRRAGYGASPQALRDVAAAGGARAWLEGQLRPQDIGDAACEAILRRFPEQSEDIWMVREAIADGTREGWRQLQSVTTGHVVRAAWSRRQLLTVMEEFWANHFNVTVPGDNIEDSRAHYQHTLRSLSLGRFEDLLFAASTHPSMLTYLNNRDSDDAHPNENQGRELLELHTVGIDAGYGEAGVLNSARILTGLSVDDESGEFAYKPWRHWTGPVAVLGFNHPNADRRDGLAVVRAYLKYLAHHPATARMLATKLARRFVSDSPPASLVAELAAIYLAQDTAVTPMLRHIFAAAEFWATMGAKTRRPFESMIATLRILGVGVGADGTDHLSALSWMAEDAGQAPFGAVFPTGWPDVAATWSSTAVTLHRWNTTRNLVAGGWPGELGFPLLRDVVLPTPLPATHGQAVDAIADALFAMPLLPAHRVAVLNFVGKTAAAPLRGTSELVTWRLADVVALLLDSPYHHYR